MFDTETEEFFSIQLDVEELYEYVDEWCEQIGFAQIEKFVITERTIRVARVDDPMDVIGYLKYAAWRCGFMIGWSKPADVMKTFTDGALRKGGMYTKGCPHGNDAARHLAWNLVRAGHKQARDFLLS